LSELTLLHQISGF